MVRRPQIHHSTDISERQVANLPANDPRFDGLRAVIAAAQQRGRASPVPRLLGEWALLGFLLTTGQIALGGEASLGLLAGARADLEQMQQAQAHVDAALDGVDWG